MKAVVVNESRQLEVFEVPEPEAIPSGHILVDVAAAGINHGDKVFLNSPTITSGLNTSQHNIWGASASGKVRAMGPDVPAEFAGKNVALYRSLTPSPHTVGLWSEQAVVPFTSAVMLPDDAPVEEYSGSLVNAITALAFLEEIAAEGHKGVIVTAGSSATGLAMAALAKRKRVPAIFLMRSEVSRASLSELGVKHALSTDSASFDADFERLTKELQATAVFDGVGGELISRIAPSVPENTTISFYGFLAGTASISFPSALVMRKNLVLKRFSNFNSATVKDPSRLRSALTYLAGIIGDSMFRTKVGKRFSLAQINEAIAYETNPGPKAILVPQLH